MGAYVGFATVGAFCVWYMFDSFLGLDLSADGHSTVTWYQLRNWEQCRAWPDFKVRSRMHSQVVSLVLGQQLAFPSR